MSKTLHLQETTSTNDYLKDLLRKEKLDEGFIVWTDFQSAGKGQIGNVWESEFGKNITMSAVFYPQGVDAASQFILSQFVSLAVADLLEEYIPSGVSIKWPNDIYVGDKKIAGILIENSILGQHIDSCIVGIGINVNQEVFLSNAPNPVSIKQLTGQNYSLPELLCHLQNQLYFRYIQLCNSDEATIISNYKHKLYRKEGIHKYQANGCSFQAKFKNIKPSGYLVLEEIDGKEHEFAFKEVQFLF